MKRFRAGLLAAVLVLTAVAGSWANQDPSILAEFDVHNDGDWLIIPVTVHGKTYQFVVDTGCSQTVIDSTLTRGESLHSEEWKRPGHRVVKTLTFYKAPEIKVGNIAWQAPYPVIGEDLTDLRELSGHSFYGLLGMDFLADYAVQVNFDAGKMRLLRSPCRPNGKAIPIVFDKKRSRPLVVGEIAGWGPEAHHIDTGARGYGDLRKELFHFLAHKGMIRNLASSKAGTLCGTEKTAAGWLPGFSIDEGSPRSLNIGESPFGISALGVSFWRRFNVILDFPNETVYLEKSRCGEDDLHDYSGLAFTRKGKVTSVLEIKKGSPADNAGLKAGDVVLSIDGKSVAEARFIELSNIFKTPGKKVAILYKRGDMNYEVALELKSWKEKPPRTAYFKKAPSRKTQATLLVNRGRAFGMRKDAVRALADFDEAIRLNPRDVDALFYRSEVFADKKEYIRALADLNKAISLKPKDAGLVWARGQLFYTQGYLEKAFESFQKCVHLDPKNPAAFCEIGRRYCEQGNFEKALACADQAIQLFPEEADAIALRAACLAMLKHEDKALKEFDRAIRINPRCGSAYYGRGIMLTNAGDYQKALPDLIKGIELGQRTWQIYLARATVYHHRREQEKEIADLEEVLHLDPNNSLAHRGLAWNLATGPKKLRDGRRALVLAQKLCAWTEYKDANALEVLAAAHAEAGNYREAVRWQQSAIQIYAASGSRYDRYYFGFEPVELARMRLGSYEKNTPLRE